MVNKVDNRVKEKHLLYSWRVIAMLNFLKTMTEDESIELSDFRTVIEDYIAYAKEKVDARRIELKHDEF